MLGCYRYIELNPVRANMTEHPAQYPRSRYRANAQGEASALLTPHPLYAALGTDEKARQAAYRELSRYQLDPKMIEEIRAATNGNFALASPRFQARLLLRGGGGGRGANQGGRGTGTSRGRRRCSRQVDGLKMWYALV